MLLHWPRSKKLPCRSSYNRKHLGRNIPTHNPYTFCCCPDLAVLNGTPRPQLPGGLATHGQLWCRCTASSNCPPLVAAACTVPAGYSCNNGGNVAGSSTTTCATPLCASGYATTATGSTCTSGSWALGGCTRECPPCRAGQAALRPRGLVKRQRRETESSRASAIFSCRLSLQLGRVAYCMQTLGSQFAQLRGGLGPEITGNEESRIALAHRNGPLHFRSGY